MDDKLLPSRGNLRSLMETMQYSRSSAKTTITSTVVIRVTPKDDYLVSWGILWGSFFAAALLSLWQVWKEYKLLSERRHTVDGADHQADEVSTADITRSNVSFDSSIDVVGKMDLKSFAVSAIDTGCLGLQNNSNAGNDLFGSTYMAVCG